MPSYINQISSLGPKIWYRFNETAGTPVNSGSTTSTLTQHFTNLLLNEQTDVDGRAVYSNDGQCRLSQMPEFTLFDDRSFTIETWFKTNQTFLGSRDESFLWSFRGRTTNLQLANNSAAVALFNLQIFGGTHGVVADRYKIQFNTTIGSLSDPTISIKSTATVADDKWHHVVAVVNTTSLKFYLDGQLVGTGTPPTATRFYLDNSASHYGINYKIIGAYDTNNSSSYKGWIDEFAAYDYELSAAQVLANFNAGASVDFADTVGTATALTVMPAFSTECVQVATPMTASSLFVETLPSNFNYVDGIQKIISDLSPDQWIKFDYVTDTTSTNPFGTLTNYGSGGGSFSTYAIGDAKQQKGPAQEPRLELRLGSGSGNLTSGFATTTNSAFFSTEVSDNDCSIGIWFKMPSGIDTSDKQIFGYSGGTNSAINLKVSNKKVQFNVQTSHTTYTHTETNDISENVWHLAVIRLDLTNTTLKYYLDGTEVYSDTAIQGTRNTPTTFSFGKSGGNGTDTTTKFQEISHFFVSSYSAATATVITNLYNAGTRQNQAKGVMPSPVIQFQNKYDDYVASLNPITKLGFNETSGTTLENVGSNLNSPFTVQGSNYTRGTSVLTKNRYGYNFTNKNTYVSGAYGTATGSLSDNTMTISVYAKQPTVSGSDVSLIALFGAGNTAQGSGIGLVIGANSSGPYLGIVPTTNPATWYTLSSGSTSYFGDWHLYTAVRDGSTTRFYIDGKQVASGTYSAYNFTDSGFAAIGGGETVWLGAAAATVDKYIDEFAAFDYALSAQQIFEMWQAIEIDRMNATTATFVMPTNVAGTGYTNTPAPMTASSLFVESTQTDEINLVAGHLEAHSEFLHPNYGGNVVIDANYGHTAATASAVFHMPQYNIGEFNSADHMNASALMVHPISTGGGKITVPTAVATDATLVMPGIVAILGARIFAEPMRSNAVFILPPDYYLVSDDKWYQRLLDVDYQSSQYPGNIVFFNTSTNIPVTGSYGGLTAASSINLYTSPTPLAQAGYFDIINRRALKLNNIALTYDPGNYGEEYTDGWTFETLIQTTKKNQILSAGYFLSTIYRNKRTGIRLKDGKIALIQVKDQSGGPLNSKDPIAFTGFKDIADGEWHHLIIQYRDDDNRIQVWIDGKLDIQRYGYTSYLPLQIGYNSNDIDASSDFNVSAVSINKESFVLEREITLNYFAAVGHVPYEAEPFTATANIGIGSRAKGNRARALMLYFWPTYKADSGYYVGNITNRLGITTVNDSEGHDVGNGEFDYDTFQGLSTYLTKDTQKFFDWDVFPLPVKRFYSGDTYVGDRNPLLNESVIVKSGTPQGTVYIDPVTDNYRYLDLMKDVYELDQYDAIFFRNYPDQSNEKELMGLNSYTEVDEYFNLQEKELFAKFLESLREAIDTHGISLFITNPQLAIDMGIIDAATPVPLLRGAGVFNVGEFSDTRAPVVTGRVDLQGNPTDPVNEYSAGWYDTWFNDKHRVINTLEYLTDDNTFIWTDYAFYQNSDNFNYGGPDRYYARYENRPYGLQIGDEFVFADSGNPKFRLPYQAVKPEHLNAGIPITALGRYIWNQNKDGQVQVENPYKDYITTIALPPGTNLKGKLTGGKIFVSFSENFANSFTLESPQFNTRYAEYHQYDMASNYWVDIAFNAGIIDANTRALYKNSSLTDEVRGQPPLYSDGDAIKQYWSLSGDNLLSQITPVTRNLVGFIGGDVGPEVPEINKKRTRSGLNSLPPSIGTRVRDALGRFASGGGSFGISGGNLKTFKITMGRVYDTGTVFIPSINTRGLWWLSDKNKLEGKVVGGVGMSASATMVNPVVTADHPALVTATSMIAQAEIFDSTFRSGDKINLTFPLFAQAMMPSLGGVYINAAPATGSGDLLSSYVYTQSDYVVTLYLRHTDPILYIRKEVIK